MAARSISTFLGSRSFLTAPTRQALFASRYQTAKASPLTAQTACARSIQSRTYASSAPQTEAAGSRRRVKAKNTDMLYYTVSILVGTLGLSYAAVPLYRMFCSATGLGGTPQVGETKFSPERLVPKENHRRIKVRFNADTSTSLQWSFQPQQRQVSVLPGETSLAFYTAKNKSQEDVIGIATYNVAPSKVAPHFNKIQCFCFEEQKLHAGESVDMPIFFFIDPEFADDPDMADVDTVTLSYTFFKARGMPFEKQPGLAEQVEQRQKQANATA
ncbi:Cytochrome c oxidase assembly protein cox11, mitochondrial [Linnemannia zychae]|nr:Cytochrome c oxidase assembly protein cox11, mitochondrial [Linnemannia zychae]